MAQISQAVGISLILKAGALVPLWASWLGICGPLKSPGAKQGSPLDLQAWDLGNWNGLKYVYGPLSPYCTALGMGEKTVLWYLFF